MIVHSFRDGLIIAKRRADDLLNILNELESYEIPNDISVIEIKSLFNSLDKIAMFIKGSEEKRKIMDQKMLNTITQYLINNIFRNPDYMFDTEHSEDVHSDLIDIIATLHNYLWECVTGEKYDYMRHWANKCGADCNDNFDMRGKQKGDGDK